MMNGSELDAAVMVAVGTQGDPVPIRWVEVWVWANHFNPRTIHEAPDTFRVSRAVNGLVDRGLLAIDSHYRVHLPTLTPPSNPR